MSSSHCLKKLRQQPGYNSNHCTSTILVTIKKMFSWLPVQKPQKPPSDDEDDDSNSLSTMKASCRDRPGRAKKEVKYFDESDNEDDDEDDDMFD